MRIYEDDFNEPLYEAKLGYMETQETLDIV